MKRVIFPDSKSLQPMPDSDIKPNISGNINSTTGLPIQEKNTVATTEPSKELKTNKEASPSGVFTYFVMIVVVILIAIFAYKKIR